LALRLVSRQVVTIWNLVLKIRRLKYTCTELCQYGPMKPPEKQGYVDDDEAMADSEAMAKANPHWDPTGKRTGANPAEELADVIRRTVADAEEAISKRQFENKVEFTQELLQDHVDKIRGALMIAYPMGLPDWEPARQVTCPQDEHRTRDWLSDALGVFGLLCVALLDSETGRF